MADVNTRLDNMEVNIKKDIQRILEILQQQQQLQQHQLQQPHQQMHDDPQHGQNSQMAGACGIDKQSLLLETSYQPSGSDFSFELFALDAKQETPAHSQQQQQQQQQRSSNIASTSQVHRSISQPECTEAAADKSLLR